MQKITEYLKTGYVKQKESFIDDYNKQKEELFNSAKGDGNCPICKGKGFVMKIENGYEYLGYCVCKIKEINNERIAKSGLSDIINKYTFENFETKEEWQKRFKASAIRFSQNPSGWFYAGGQSGCGKTHICTAITKSLMDKGFGSRYMIWPSEIIKLKANKNSDEEYQRLISTWQLCRVLYIDDFFKQPSGSNSTPTQSDIMTAFEILNYRYNNRNKLITIISSEHSIDDLIYYDEALGSRIFEMSKGSINIIKNESKRNFRLSS